MLTRLRKAQTTAEYAIMIALVIAAVLAMQTYVKRGLQAKMKDATDALTEVSGDVTGEGVQLGQTWQYEPYYLSSSSQQQGTSTKTEDVARGGRISRTSQQQIKRTSRQTSLYK